MNRSPEVSTCSSRYDVSLKAGAGDSIMLYYNYAIANTPMVIKNVNRVTGGSYDNIDLGVEGLPTCSLISWVKVYIRLGIVSIPAFIEPNPFQVDSWQLLQDRAQPTSLLNSFSKVKLHYKFTSLILYSRYTKLVLKTSATPNAGGCIVSK